MHRKLLNLKSSHFYVGLKAGPDILRVLSIHRVLKSKEGQHVQYLKDSFT